MASMSDIFSNSIGPLAQQIGGMAGTDAEAESDATLNKQRLFGAYKTRSLPDLVSRYASRGTFRSSAAQTGQQRLTEDTMNSLGDVDRLMARQRAQMARDRVMAATGSLF